MVTGGTIKVMGDLMKPHSKIMFNPELVRVIHDLLVFRPVIGLMTPILKSRWLKPNNFFMMKRRQRMWWRGVRMQF